MTAPALVPSYVGHVKSTAEAILLFEGCLQGVISHVSRRPHDRERSHLIKSGNVFIYEENSSGIKRWTDGIPWSPSRILGNFLVYRELERPFPPGEKKRAMKRTSKKSPGISKTELGGAQAPHTAASALNSTSAPNETTRSLIGSLVDSYGFKEGGLVKKTISITVNGVSHHLVSYYSVDDVLNNRLSVPSKDTRLHNVIPRHELLHNQNFRAAADEADSMDRMSGEDRTIYGGYSYAARTGYEMTNQSFAHRPIPLPTPPQQTYSQQYPTAPSSMYGYNAAPHQSTNYSQQSPVPAAPGVEYGGYTVPAPGIYPRSESYEQSTARSRYNSTGAMSANGNRVTMPPASSFPRRSSTYETSGSFDSGVSVSSSASDTKPSNSAYTTQSPATFYDASRDAAHSYQQGQHRVLPQSHEPRQPHPTPLFPMETKDAWSMQSGNGIGQNSLGHGHYVQPPQQWAGAVSN